MFSSKQKPLPSSSLLSSLLTLHSNRAFRSLICGMLLLHILTLLLPLSHLSFTLPTFLNPLLNKVYVLWPFPTFKMTENDQIFLKNAIFKVIELLVIGLYILDLVPKIFFWRKPLYWKLMNIFVVTIMVVQVSLTMVGFLESGKSEEQLKLRISSISLLFILMCEIMTIRERRNLLQTKKRNSSLCQKNVIRKDETEAIIPKTFLKYKKYAWIEITKHDRPGDCWVVIHGKVYDLTNFVSKHPGGPMIYDGAGGDCTAMWQSYHSSKMIRKSPPTEYLIGEVRDYVDFYSWDGDFYLTLKEKVEALIPKNKRQFDYKLFIKAGIIFVGYVVSLYYFLQNYTFTWAVIYSIFAAQTGVNIMHDGNHMAFTSNKFISLLAGYTLDMAFSTSVVYRRSHNFGHHGCVNHFELDRAFDTSYPLLRLHHLQPKLPFHKYQHVYAWLVYGLVNFGDLFGTFDELFWMSNYPTRRGFLTKTSFISQIMVKIVWLLLMGIWPIYKWGFVEMFPIWVTYMMTFSYFYVFFFAVNHWTDEAQQVDNKDVNKTNWGILQVENSSNFALDSFFWTNASGGLNFQIEHHLFPQLAHTRLPEIAPIVQEMSKKYNLRYFKFSSFWSAMYGHYRHLKNLANMD